MGVATIICGSGNPKGHTSAMCRAAAEELASRGYSVRMFCPSDMAIADCDGCDSCATEGRCRKEDDMRFVYGSFGESDLLIIASPIFFDGLSSPTVRALGRFQLHWNRRELERPKECLALLCGGRGVEGGCPAQKVVERFCRSMGIGLIGIVTVERTDGHPVEETYSDSRERIAQALGDRRQRKSGRIPRCGGPRRGSPMGNPPSRRSSPPNRRCPGRSIWGTPRRPAWTTRRRSRRAP
ncbi:MAG: flavodoxin family protein [Candidatus Methanomethylophilaceae archaeon]|nr:flavodoxin family protein [Candidatus Methanomethylophilaceae archaeon]